MVNGGRVGRGGHDAGLERLFAGLADERLVVGITMGGVGARPKLGGSEADRVEQFEANGGVPDGA